ncbi:MAG: ABC transporter ATP-binding protein [Halorubrum sp.]
MSRVELENVTKEFSEGLSTITAVNDISLTVEDGEFLVIVGPSGCGKSTTLRMLAGLETVTEGTIRFDGEEVQELKPPARNIAMVFQNYALYPSMNVRENIGYGLKHTMGMRKAKRTERVDDIAEMLGITDQLDQQPNELSGGQRQRVALGRALVREPNVFLLDEPLSNLDAKLRARMRQELQQIHDDLGITSIYVTHDQKEAMTMADRIAILDQGELQQVGEVEDVYNRPTNRFVAGFIGSPSMNFLPVSLRRNGSTVEVRTESSTVCTLDADRFDGNYSRATAGIRPEHLDLTTDADSSWTRTSVGVSEYQGDSNFVYLTVEGTSLVSRTAESASLSSGDDVSVSVDPNDLYLFDPDTGKTIKSRSGAELTSR